MMSLPDYGNSGCPFGLRSIFLKVKTTKKPSSVFRSGRFSLKFVFGIVIGFPIPYFI